MATFSSDFWNNYRCVNTPKGIYRSVYHPKRASDEGEYVIVVAEGEKQTKVNTPALADWSLLVDNAGELVIQYLKIDGNNRVEVRKNVGINVGTATPPPPTGPTEREEIIAEIKRLVDLLA